MARQCKSLGILVAILLFLFSAFAGAAQVRAVKGNKLLIQLDGSMFNVGDILKVKDFNGHVRALAKVTKVAGRFAEAVYKGRPMQGYTAVLFPHDQYERWRAAMRRRRMQRGAQHHEYTAESSTPSTTSYGGFLGYTSSSASVTLTQSANRKVSLSGTGFSLMGFMDKPLLNWFSFRGEAGFNQFNTTGSTDPSCNNGACTAKITYLSADLLGRFTHNAMWAGAGIDLMFPLSKSSTALSSSSISTVTAYALAAGYNFHMSGEGNPYIPVELQYLIFPSSSTVTASEMVFQVGYGKTF